MDIEPTHPVYKVFKSLTLIGLLEGRAFGEGDLCHLIDVPEVKGFVSWLHRMLGYKLGKYLVSVLGMESNPERVVALLSGQLVRIEKWLTKP
jgi:hypothetical protein